MECKVVECFLFGLQLNVKTFHSFATLTTQELPQLVGCQDAAPEPTQTAKMAKTPHARRGPTVASLGRDEKPTRISEFGGARFTDFYFLLRMKNLKLKPLC